MADYTTIDNPAKHFNTLLFTGDGTSSRGITGVGFQPDWLWLKTRSKTNSHILIDVVRGANRLRSESTAAEASVSGEFISFDTDGFTLTENSSNEMNNNSTTYATWNWLGANGTASNSDGGTSSTVSVNQTAGFSVVGWTGTGSATTVGHGLGAAPELILLKNRSEVYGWQVYFKVLGSNKYLALNHTDAEATSTESWNNTAPTSTVFSVGASDSNNKSGNNIIAYCFKEKQGYSKFGKWTGTGQSSGPFIYTGFRPAFLSWKMSSSTENWYINDNKREPFNDDAMTVLYPNLTNSDGALNDEIDLLSNGFKINGTNSAHNTDGATYVYWAFAEHPFVTAGTKAAGTAR